MTTNALKYLIKEFGELTFADMILSIRTTDEISQTDLATQIGVSRGIICDIEKGRRLPTIEQAKDMAEFLGYPAEGFISILLQDQLRKAKVLMKVSLEKVAS